MAKDDSSDRLISNSVYLMMDWITITVLSLILWLVVGKTLPTAGYGIVATSVNISLLIAAFSLLGLPSAVTNLISRFAKKNQWKKIKGLIKFSVKFSIIVNISAAVAITLLSPQLALVLNLPIEAIWMVALLIFGWTFWLLTNGFLQGFQNMRLIFKSNLVGHLFKVGLPITLALIGFGFLGPLLGFLIGFLVTIAMRYETFVVRGGTKIQGRKVLFGIAIPVFIASVMWLIFTNLPNVILNAIKSPDVTGIFAIALTVATPITFIPMTLSQALFPVTSGLSVTRNPAKRQSKLIALVVKYAAFITLPIIALLLVFSSQIILFFSQPQYLPATQLLPIVAVAALFLGIGQILVSSVFAIGKIKMTRNITIAVATIFLAISIPLTFLLSSFGMAIAYLLSMMVLILSSFLFLKRTIKFSIDWKSIGKIFIAVLIFVAITYPLNAILHTTILKIAVILLGIVAYFSALGFLRYYTMDEVKVVRYMMSRSASLKKFLRPLEKLLSKNV